MSVPGAGKTGVAILLLLGLCRDQRMAQVPVLVPAASWNPEREHLGRWLARRIAAGHYAGDVEVPLQLLACNMIMPILDGLDEIPERLRPAALLGIERARGRSRPLVLTARIGEYAQPVADTGIVLPRTAAIELAPVTPGDAADYLIRSARRPEPSAITLFDVTARTVDPRIHWLPVEVSTGRTWVAGRPGRTEPAAAHGRLTVSARLRPRRRDHPREHPYRSHRASSAARRAGPLHASRADADRRRHRRPPPSS
jgi:hypothetical protein